MFDQMLVESVSSLLKCNLDSGEYQCNNSGGRPYLTNSRGSVLCIYNEQFNDEHSQSQHFISRAQDFYAMLPQDIKVLAQRKIIKANPQIAGASIHARCSESGVATPGSTLLTETQCQLLKGLFEDQIKSAFFNPDQQAITAFDESLCYLPNEFNGFTVYRDIRPLANFEAIEQQYTQWAGHCARNVGCNATAVHSLSQQPSSTGITHAVYPTPLPPQGRQVNVQSIAAVIDYVTPGYRPLVIFDMDETLVARDIINGEAIRVAVESDTVQILQRIRQKASDVQIIVLTQATEEATRSKLQAVNIDERLFDSIESVADKMGTKGSVLEQYIRHMPEKPEQVCYVDDMDLMLDDVESTCVKLQIHCNSFLYTGAKELEYKCTAHALGMPVDQLKSPFEMV